MTLDGQVSRIVRARGNFIDQHTAVGQNKKLDTEDTNDVKRLGHLPGDLNRSIRRRLTDRRGAGGNIQNMVGMIANS